MRKDNSNWDIVDKHQFMEGRKAVRVKNLSGLTELEMSSKQAD